MGGGNHKRIAGLDVLRVLMALLIYMFHSRGHFCCSYGFLNDFVEVGAIAMTGFFALSGYSLRLNYGDRNLMEKKELGRFYVKRMLGVLPLYYTLALMYVLFIGKETVVQNLLLFPIELLGLQSTFCSLFGVTHNGGTWFISCLLLGYLIYPFIQTVVKQLNVRQKVILLIVLICIDLWAPIVRINFHTAWVYDNPFFRIVEFCIGLIVADINMTRNGKLMKVLRSWEMLLLSSLILVIGVSMIQHIYGIRDFMLLNWIVLPCGALMLFPLGSMKMLHLENSKILCYCSKISFSFFLSQFFVWEIGAWFVELIGYDSNMVRIVFTFTVCVVISVLMYEVVQKQVVGYFRIKFSN